MASRDMNDSYTDGSDKHLGLEWLWMPVNG